MGRTPEAKVKDKINSWIKKNIPLVWKFMPVSRGYGAHGIPDYILCVPKTITQDMVGKTIGMFVGIEAKPAIKGRDPTKYQIIQIDAIRQASGIAFVLKGKPENIHAMLDSIKHIIL